MELRRKLFHITFGVIALGLCLLSDREYAVAFLCTSLFAGLLILSRKLRGHKVPLADDLLAVFSRPGEPPGYGAFWYVFGLLAITTFIVRKEEVLASVLMLGFADGASTLLGVQGRRRLPHNKNKTLEGSLVFFAVSLISFMWLGPISIPFAFAGSLLESLDTRIDDNTLISLYCIAFFFLL